MNQGFTLLEVLLASLLLSILGTLAWGSLSATFLTQKTVNERTELQEIGTSSLLKMRDDLTQTFQVESYRPLTIFKGEDNFDRDRVTFTSLSHVRLQANRHESDQTKITYETDTDSDHPGLYRLRRKESRHLDDKEETDDIEFETLATNVITFELEYHNGQEYRPTWDSRAVDQLNKLPKAVHISLKLKDARDREETFETYVDIPMNESLGSTLQGQPPAGTGTPPPNPNPTVAPK